MYKNMFCSVMYKKEFPDFELDVELPERMIDSSWHNNTMPSWRYYRFPIEIWIDYKDEEQREMQGKRFSLVVLGPFDEDSGSLITSIRGQTENWKELLSWYYQLLRSFYRIEIENDKSPSTASFWD